MYELIAFSVLIGAMAQRIAGMGFALTLAPILVLLFGPYEGPLIVNLAGAFSSFLVIFQTYKWVDWKQYFSLAVPAVIVIVPSAFFSAAFSGPPLQIAIGVILIIALSTSLIVVRKTKVLPRGRLGILFGASSGFMSATAGIGGPALGIYAILTDWDQKRFAATLQPYFLTLGLSAFVAKVSITGQWPGIPGEVWLLVGVLTIVGSWLGLKLQKHVSANLAKLIVVFVCFGGSIAAIIDGITKLAISG